MALSSPKAQPYKCRGNWHFPRGIEEAKTDPLEAERERPYSIILLSLRGAQGRFPEHPKGCGGHYSLWLPWLPPLQPSTVSGSVPYQLSWKFVAVHLASLSASSSLILLCKIRECRAMQCEAFLENEPGAIWAAKEKTRGHNATLKSLTCRQTVWPGRQCWCRWTKFQDMMEDVPGGREAASLPLP